MELTLDQALQQAIAAHKEGKLQDAERLYRAILQAQPDHPDANHNLGVLAVAIGEPLEAIPLFKLALEAHPQIEQFWLSYIDVLIRLERFVEAKRFLSDGEKSGVSTEKLEFFRQQLQTVPLEKRKDSRQDLTVLEKRKAQGDSSGAVPSQNQINRLFEYYQSARFVDAEELAVSLTQQFPEHPFGWKVLGVVLKQMGRLDESLPLMQKSVQLSLQDAEAHTNLGVTLRALGRLGEAEASYRQAIALRPDYAEVHNNLGNVLTDLGRLAEAEASLTQAIALKPNFAEAHYNLGNTLQELGRLYEAEEAYKQAIALKPDYAKAHNNLGNTFQKLGRSDDAKASLRQAIALKPDYAEAHRNLGVSNRFSSKDEQFMQMEELYRDPNISESDRCHICFALARASDNLEDCAAAFQFYTDGNALRKKQLGYDKLEDKKLFERLKASYPRINAHTPGPETVAPEYSPIFIVGMLRSGTTLVEQIISSHPRVTGAGELPFVSQYGRSLAAGPTPVDAKALTTFREQYLQALKQRSEGNAIVTDKMPQNFLFIGLITAALPDAKIIHVKRDPAAVCWANYTQYFDSEDLSYCYDLDDILHYHELYQDLMQYWHQALPNKIYDLDYEVLTEDQEEETRKLIGYLSLGWDGACMSPQENKRGVATASLAQVRRNVYQGSSERWKRYRPYLNGVLDQFGAK